MLYSNVCNSKHALNSQLLKHSEFIVFHFLLSLFLGHLLRLNLSTLVTRVSLNSQTCISNLLRILTIYLFCNNPKIYLENNPIVFVSLIQKRRHQYFLSQNFITENFWLHALRLYHCRKLVCYQHMIPKKYDYSY